MHYRFVAFRLGMGLFPACNRLSSMARTVILSDSGKWVTLLRFEWEWGLSATFGNC